LPDSFTIWSIAPIAVVLPAPANHATNIVPFHFFMSHSKSFNTLICLLVGMILVTIVGSILLIVVSFIQTFLEAWYSASINLF